MAERTRKGRLVVVESPAKAKTIGKYLGAGYKVKASVGHIRDLPERELGVDIERGFEPKYVTIRGKGKVIMELRREADSVEEVLLATDPDREGEAIAWHVAEQLGYEGNGDAPRFRRVLFHEITRDAVQRALQQPLDLDMRKVEAQQARRILDRLVGYQASPLLWKPIRPGLSAGRVQTVALRLITEREDEIRRFVAEEYWSITAHLEKSGTEFEAKLHHIDGKAFKLSNEASATDVFAEIKGQPFKVTEIKRRERLKNPPAPFTTSTLQQEAAKRLGFSAQKTMRAAQQLYEGVELGAEGSVGLITYMRTDSTRVAPSAAAQAREWIEKTFGSDYAPEGGVRLWGGKQQKGAQEAHEAIRPTDPTRRPEDVRSFLDRDQYRLYELVWLRFVAGQMASAVYDTTTVDFDIAGRSGRQYLFRATGSVVKFDGFTRLYQEAREDGDHKTLDELAPLPRLEKNDLVNLRRLDPAQHFTQPPPRFTEASLVKELERLGIGRPSTYAQIISTLTDREYVKLEQKKFMPTPLGETVARVLVRVFPELFDVTFTSQMEGELDRIEEGELEWQRVLQDFYKPFHRQLQAGEQAGDALVREVVSADSGPCSECGRAMLVRWNRFGRFLGCSGYPECRHTESLDQKERKEAIPTGESCPNCKSDLVEKEGRFGPFIACSNYPECKYTQPKTIPGLACPECGVGKVGEKRTRRGKPFWGCTRYPDCSWSSWDRPVPGPCPDCGSSFLVERSTKTRGDYTKCPKCNMEFTRDDAGRLEHAAPATASAPVKMPRTPARKAAAKKSAATKTSATKTAATEAATKSTARNPAVKKTAARKTVSAAAGARKSRKSGDD